MDARCTLVVAESGREIFIDIAADVLPFDQDPPAVDAIELVGFAAYDQDGEPVATDKATCEALAWLHLEDLLAGYVYELDDAVREAAAEARAEDRFEADLAHGMRF